MIENNGKRYYTPYEIVDLITNSDTDIHKKWKERFPKYENVILFEQVNRKKKKKIKKLLLYSLPEVKRVKKYITHFY